jgi:hypothetical protein
LAELPEMPINTEFWQVTFVGKDKFSGLCRTTNIYYTEILSLCWTKKAEKSSLFLQKNLSKTLFISFLELTKAIEKFILSFVPKLNEWDKTVFFSRSAVNDINL